ncbi:MAG: hypothetical protein A4E60_01988 [Syntrophorhabdus sp. PtaB.Bin047]|nr:MAG: hypothetical protein A4E60_01988 [Syntrophorhabdus sp. PtaB.Bin047]
MNFLRKKYASTRQNRTNPKTTPLFPKLRSGIFEKYADMPSSPPVYREKATRTRKYPTWQKARLISAKQAPVVRTMMGPRMTPMRAPATSAARMARSGFWETCSEKRVTVYAPVPR